jgi:hypothetical protein
MVGMPKSIQRGFIVGDRHFLTYDEARIYAAENKAVLQRHALMTFLSDSLTARLSETDLTEIACALLDAYEIKPKKRNG